MSLKGELALDGSGWERSLNRAAEQTTHFASHQIGHLKDAIAGAFAVGAIELTIDKAIEFGEAIYHSSRRVGEHAQELIKLDHALSMNGSTLEAGIAAMEKFNLAKDKALGDGPEAATMARNFERLGISLAELKEMRGAEFLFKVSDAFKGGIDPQSLVGPLREIAGKGAGELIPALREDLREAGEEAANFAKLMDDNVIATLKIAGDQSHDLWKWTKAIGAGFVSAFEGLEVAGKAAFAGVAQYFKDFKLLFQGKFFEGKSPFEAVKEQFHKDAEEFHKIRDKLSETLKPVDVEAGASKSEEKTRAKDMRDLAAAYERLHAAEERNQLAGLNREQKITELKKRQAEIVEKYNNETNELEEVKDKTKFYELDAEIKTLEAEKEHRATHPRQIKTDSLISVGNFLGESGRNIPAIQERMIDAQRKNTEALHNLAHALRTAGLNGGGSSQEGFV